MWPVYLISEPVYEKCAEIEMEWESVCLKTTLNFSSFLLWIIYEFAISSDWLHHVIGLWTSFHT